MPLKPRSSAKGSGQWRQFWNSIGGAEVDAILRKIKPPIIARAGVITQRELNNWSMFYTNNWWDRTNGWATKIPYTASRIAQIFRLQERILRILGDEIIEKFDAGMKVECGEYFLKSEGKVRRKLYLCVDPRSHRCNRFTEKVRIKRSSTRSAGFIRP